MIIMGYSVLSMIFNTLKRSQVLSVRGWYGATDKDLLGFLYQLYLPFCAMRGNQICLINHNFQAMLFYLMMSKHSQQSRLCYSYTRLCSNTFICLIYVPIRLSIWLRGKRIIRESVFSSIFIHKTGRKMIFERCWLHFVSML